MADQRRALVAACIGNVVEWYDFALYGAFATVLARTYFPSADTQPACWRRSRCSPRRSSSGRWARCC